MPYEWLWFLDPSMIVAIVAWMGIVLSYLTVQQFTLRYWKHSAYFFLTAMTVFMVYKLLQPFLTGPYIIFQVELKAFFIILITIGIYNLKQTAETVGA